MNNKDQTLVGSAFAFAAFGSWGALPIYFKAISHVSALQILAHRVVWSVLLLAVLVTVMRRWPAIGAALRDRRTLLMLGSSTLFIGVNWLTFIWAVQAERVMEISLGYYINPLVIVLLGVLVLRERLNAAQGAAVALATAGVANLAIQTTGLPWPSLVLAFSFGIYGLIRKTTMLGSVDGLFLETTLMAPAALGYLVFIGYVGSSAFGTIGAGTDLLLVAAGAVTALPLIWFASGARRLPYVAIGFFQYLAPSGHFLLAVFVFGEPFTTAHLVTFGCIWAGLIVFSADTWRRAMRYRRARATMAAD